MAKKQGNIKFEDVLLFLFFVCGVLGTIAFVMHFTRKPCATSTPSGNLSAPEPAAEPAATIQDSSTVEKLELINSKLINSKSMKITFSEPVTYPKVAIMVDGVDQNAGQGLDMTRNAYLKNITQQPTGKAQGSDDPPRLRMRDIVWDNVIDALNGGQGVQTETSGKGQGAELFFTLSNGKIGMIEVSKTGYGYKPGDTITVKNKNIKNERYSVDISKEDLIITLPQPQPTKAVFFSLKNNITSGKTIKVTHNGKITTYTVP